jgi:hypothetical protein
MCTDGTYMILIDYNPFGINDYTKREKVYINILFLF